MPQPTPPAGAALAARRLALEPSTRAAFGLSAAARASATILAGSLIARLTPEATTGLPANRCLSFTPTSVAKMTASAPAMVDAGQRGAARRALSLDVQRDARFFGGGDERVGGHVGVRDAGRARGDRDQGLRLVGGRRLAAGAALRLVAGVEHLVDECDHLVGRRRLAQRLHELLAHQRAGQAGQQLHVLGAAGFGCRDQERQIRGAVGCAEVDGRLQPGETDRGGVDVRRAAVRDRDAARAARWPTVLRGPWRRRSVRRRRRCGPASASRPTRRPITACLSAPASTSSSTRSASMMGREAVLVMAILSVGCYELAGLVSEGEIDVTRTALRSISAGVGSAEPGSAAAALP